MRSEDFSKLGRARSGHRAVVVNAVGRGVLAGLQARPGGTADRLRGEAERAVVQPYCVLTLLVAEKHHDITHGLIVSL